MTDTSPHSLDAERAVLGAILLLGERALGVLAADVVLRPEHFYREQHAVIYAAMLELADRDRAIDPLTVTEQLKATGQLAELGADALVIDEYTGWVPMAGSYPEYGRLVVEHAMWRGRREAALAMLEAVGVRDQAAFDTAESLIASSDRPDDTTSSPGQLRDEMLDWLVDENPDAIPTPFQAINGFLSGGLRRGDVTLIGGWSSHGKALDVATPIPTPDGWRTMLDLRPGDSVFDESGNPTRVAWVSPVQFGRPCSEVVFLDGQRIVADDDHLWLTYDEAARRSERAQKARGARPRIGVDQRYKMVRPAVRTTRELAATLTTVKRGQKLNHSIPTAGPLAYSSKELPIDPYVLGLWLGDGTSRWAAITSHEDDAAFFAAEVAGSEGARNTVTVHPIAGREHICTIRIKRRRDACRRGHLDSWDDHGHCRVCVNRFGEGRSKGTWTHFGLYDQLAQLGLLRNKHIPEDYLRGDVAQRLALLQGLMDTDGHVGANVGCEFMSTNHRLAAGAYELVLGLGIRATLSTGRATINGRDCGPKYRLHFSSSLPVCRLPRKAARQPRKHARRINHRTIMAIRPVVSRPVKCIGVEAPSRLFLASAGCIPTHNSLTLDGFLEHAAGLGVKAHLYINEMSKRDRTARTIAARSGVRFGRILNKTRLNDVERQRVIRALREGLPFGATDCAGWSGQDISRHIRRHRWDIAGVDLLHLIPHETVADLDAISRQLNAAARQAGSHLLVACQLNMERYKTAKAPRPVRRDIRGSGQLFNDAANVLFIHRDQVKTEGTAAEMYELLNTGSLYLEKARNGQLGGLPVVLNPDRMRFVVRGYEDGVRLAA